MSDKIDKIKIFDDVFEHMNKTYLYEKAVRSNFKIGWRDTDIIEHREKVYMHSEWENEMVARDILPLVKNKNLLELINSRNPSKCILNCTLQNDVYLPHAHPDTDVLLYYINMEWKQEWWGETQFLSEDLKEIIFTNPYVPGRAVWFDGAIPHTIKTQSAIAPKYRFSLSLFFWKGDIPLEHPEPPTS